MRLRELIAECMRVARSQALASSVVGLVVGGAALIALATTGRTIQSEQEILSRIDTAETRLVTITDARGDAGLTYGGVERVAALSEVEWTLALGGAVDVRALAVEAAPSVAAYPIYGELPPVIRSSQWSRSPGTALVGVDARTPLGLTVPAGGVRPRRAGPDFAAVGWHQADRPLRELNSALLMVPHHDLGEGPIRTIHVMATSSAETDAIARAAMGLLSPADPNSVVVQTSPELNHMRDAIRAGLGQSARQLLALVLLSGLILVALTVFANVTARRKDFGRRRALGASRSEIVLLVAGRTVVVAVMGAVVGASVGSAIVWIWTSAPPPPGFSIAVAFLSSLAAALGAVGPAAVAAFRDPVKVLRMP